MTSGGPAIESALAILIGMRKRMQALAATIPDDELFEVPSGFANNVAWNLGHLPVTQQLLCYQLSGLPVGIPDEVVAAFRKGSSPADWKARPDVRGIIADFVTRAETLRDDYRAGRFTRFEPYTTSAGIELRSIEDAIQFNNVHEGIHLGYVMALRRAIREGR